MFRQAVKLFFVFTFAVFSFGCSKEPVTRTGFYFNTKCSVVIPASEKNTAKALDDAFRRLEEIDAKFNVLNSSSPLYSFNRNGVPINDKEIAEVARYAFKVKDESSGAFDPLIYPLVQLWNFYGDAPVVPKPEDVKKLLSLVKDAGIKINGDEISAGKKGAGLDFGALIPGYAADEAVKVLKNNGIKNALVDTGGELYALGRNGKRKWKIGLKNPRGDGIVGIIEAENEAVSTAGDYEKYIETGSKRYHHILDPKTGYPAEGIRSVTVISPTALEADAWDTAVFVLGIEKGFDEASVKRGYKTIVIDNNGKFYISPEGEKQFSKEKIK
ncbi:MAG: FAD:protein FMN transferase [Elusimicrobia bacterium]|nr:FAD:protein FMN transferase [Candidatus Liberimonas magnetica]